MKTDKSLKKTVSLTIRARDTNRGYPSMKELKRWTFLRADSEQSTGESVIGLRSKKEIS